MPNARTDKRARLMHAAVKLSYLHGFGKTALADIAEEADVPLGNVYYYFKTKDEVGEAIVEQRFLQARALRHAWDEAGSPRERLIASVQTTADRRQALASGGCCVGTLCSELRKEGGALARKASALLAEHLDWIEAQFRGLGKKNDARDLAVHLLSALQGIAVLAHSLRDSKLVATETARLRDWIAAL
jgi:TetR/AcrR family transcriptional repressor of nem operon